LALLGGTLAGLFVGATMTHNSHDVISAGVLGSLLIPNPFFGVGYLLGLGIGSLFGSGNWGHNPHYNDTDIAQRIKQQELLYDLGYFTLNNDTPSKAFKDWRWGRGEVTPFLYYFGNCEMTRALSQHRVIERAKYNLIIELQSREPNQAYPTFYEMLNVNQNLNFYYYRIEDDRFYSGEDGTIFAEELIMSAANINRSDRWEAILLETIIGSFHMNYEVRSIVWETRTAVVRFRAANNLGLRTATRIPDSTVTFLGLNPDDNPSILGDQNSGIGADVIHHFLWDEIIRF
jgi:hypothetical protein